MPNFETSAALVETATKWLAIAFSSPSALERPFPRAAGVRHCLERGKSFRRDDKQGFVGFDIARGLGEIRAVHVGDETERQMSRAL